MLKYIHRLQSAALMLGMALVAGPVVQAQDPVVNLELLPALSEVEVGETFEIQLIARAAVAEDVLISGIQAILNWDPALLRLAGTIENPKGGPDYEWLLSGLPNDSGLDNLNDGVKEPPDFLPFNDGDAFYEALGQFPPSAPFSAGPGGALVTTLLFEALAVTPSTMISMPMSAGLNTISEVWWALVPSFPLLGETFPAKVTVIPEPTTAMFLLLLAVGSVRAGRLGRPGRSCVGDTNKDGSR